MNDSPKLVLVGGGVRSGKSDFALCRARHLGERRVFMATAQAWDDEMKARIAEHVRSRGPDFRTLEEPVELVETLSALDDVDVVVIDCLTLWLSNLLLREESEAAIAVQVRALAAVLERRRFHAVVVTNEVGMGVVPQSRLGRLFRDIAGRAHQTLAAVSDEIHFAVLGTLIRLQPEPISIQRFSGGSL